MSDSMTREDILELLAKLSGILVGGGGTIAIIQLSEVKDLVSIILGCITGLCLLATTLHTIFSKKRRRKP